MPRLALLVRVLDVGLTRLKPHHIRNSAKGSSLPEGSEVELMIRHEHRACAELLTIAQGATIFLSEATFLEGEHSDVINGHGHLTGKLAGSIAKQAGAEHLVITHFSQESKTWLGKLQREASQAFGAKVELTLPNREFILQ